MSDDLVKQACEWRENGSPPEPFYAVGHLIDAMADRIEELEAKLAAERERCAKVAESVALPMDGKIVKALAGYMRDTIAHHIRKGGE